MASARLKPEALLWRIGGRSIHAAMCLPIATARDFFAELTLDRQSCTLSGGEVQRINLTTALGTSLVNTLFVLDEPSIGLHPRDIERINENF
ncbi:MAG: hypothetical protein IPH35_24455 [Rhodoferax sp.]|nr:hypothetical protein [Rhodoferax sp.]